MTMNLDLEDQPEEPKEEPYQAWIPAAEAFKKYGKNLPWLKQGANQGRIATRKINGMTMYSVPDIERSCGDEENGEGFENGLPGPMTDLLSAAREIVKSAQAAMHQAQENTLRAFNACQQATDKLMAKYEGYIDRQNAHVLKLEEHSLAMREVAERAMSLEHQRKLDEANAIHKQEIQKSALNNFAKYVGPYIAQKLSERMGVNVEGSPPTPQSSETQHSSASETTSEEKTATPLEKVGNVTISVLMKISDEQFEMLRMVTDEDEFNALKAVRDALKSEQRS